MGQVEWVECPRDAMQGLHWYIPAERKIHYLNALLKVGFDVLDFGSFVSPKAIPQLRDTAEVLAGLDLSSTSTRLLAIIANVRGGAEAAAFDEISYLGFPFSISETFQQRNTNSSMSQSLATVDALQNICMKSRKELVVYLSMAFGNPYGDAWNAEVAVRWSTEIAAMGITTIALADTVGLAKPGDVKSIFEAVIPSLPGVKFGAHLHAGPDNWKDKLQAAWDAGCRRYDTAMKGYGGCPMAEDELVGNLATENFRTFMDEMRVKTRLHDQAFEQAFTEAHTVFAAPMVT